MTDQQTRGGFAGDPTAALTVAGSTGCCGNPARSENIALPDPTDAAATCCGSPAATDAAATCCGSPAATDAAATCCGSPAATEAADACAAPAGTAGAGTTATGCCG